ncbi:hypothetical protein MWLp12_2861 [Lactiplantibacillus plantarum]|nr:hypothetical protein MWLp12_2861 [Lactiplantibacillus plantarum]
MGRFISALSTGMKRPIFYPLNTNNRITYCTQLEVKFT